MSRDPEDDALSWGDESDPTHIDAADPAERRSTPAERRAARRAAIAAEDAAVAAGTPGATIDTASAQHSHDAHGADGVATGAGAATDRATDDGLDGDDLGLGEDGLDEDDLDDAPAPMNPFVLLVIGILAGFYLLYTVGWVVTLQRATDILPSALDQLMSQLRLYLAIVAPAAWFGTTLVLTRGRRSVVRILALLLGALVLVPWSFVLGA